MNGASDPIARNLRHWRRMRDMTLSALAERAGVAKSTVSLIERGQGNPSIDTIAALASALDVPFASLFHDEPRAAEVLVVRANEVPPTTATGIGGKGHLVRHMLTRPGGALIEIYTVTLEDGAVCNSEPQLTGLLEHITVMAGRVELKVNELVEVLDRGDMISFRLDCPHTYRVLKGPARLVAVREYPRAPPLYEPVSPSS